jgi:hypothetical protein
MRKPIRLVIPVLLLALSVAGRAQAGDNPAGSPQVKAYETLMKAVAAGDYEAYKKAMTKAAGAEIDKQTKEMGLDVKKTMGFLQAMTPSDIKYTGLKVDGKKATLDATGKMDGETNWGTVELEQEDGQWKVVSQSWTNTKKK